MRHRRKKRGMQGNKATVFAGGRHAAVLICALCLLCLADFDLPASAHRVYLHAYVAGKRCFVQGLFNGTEPAADARIEVFDDQGKRLLQGKTDRKGEFAFQIPKRATLDIVLTTPLGHRGQTRVGNGDMEGPARTSGKTAAAAVSDHDHAPPAEHHEDGQSPTVVMAQYEFEALLDRAIEETLEEKLTPLYRMMAKIENRRDGLAPRLLSGIGYIVGIFGLALYVASRRKER